MIEKTYLLKIKTSANITKSEFGILVLKSENILNTGILRFHIEELPDETKETINHKTNYHGDEARDEFS